MKTLREIWRFAMSNDTPIKRKRAEKSKIRNKTWKQVTDSDKKRINNLRKKGLTYTQIAYETGRSTSTISGVINSPKKNTVNERPSDPKAVYQRHQDRIASGNMKYLPNHHLCPVCNPNSTTTWREYFAMTHKATINNARKNKNSSQWTMSNY